MTVTSLAIFKFQVGRILKNPHFWIVVALSTVLLFIYQAWPWREWQFTEGVWRFFPWLSKLNPIVIEVELGLQMFGVLFFIPIIYGSLTLSWPGGIFAWLLSLIWLAPTCASWGSRRPVLSLMLLLLPALLVAIVTGERRWRGIEKRHFAEREREARAYIAKLVEAQEGERRRIAQEIHDETLQTLMVIANKSDSLASSSANDGQSAGNLWIKQEVLKTMEDLRRLSMNLRPSILDNFGLVSGVRWLVNANNAQEGCHLDISVGGDDHPMSSLAEVTVFRVVQEAIHNIQRHSRAQHGSVALEFGEDQVTLDVQDDGIGFQQPDRLALYVNEGKLGIIGMEQRVLPVGGTMSIESAPGEGAKLRVTVPYSASTKIIQGENP